VAASHIRRPFSDRGRPSGPAGKDDGAFVAWIMARTRIGVFVHRWSSRCQPS
jgi:hypothetical protein